MGISNYLVRRMTERDLDRVMAIEQQVFTLPWSRQSYLGELRNHLPLTWFAIGSPVSGLYRDSVVLMKPTSPISGGSKWRGQGLGRVLIEEAEKIARQKKSLRIMLEVRPSITRLVTL